MEFLGYGRGRGLPHEQVLWATAGHAHFVMDTRGQGWSTAAGATPDTVSLHGDVPGFLTRGVDSPDDHYYRRVYTDAVRFTEAARAHPAVDPDRVVVTGHSQGGGIALAVAGLLPGLAGVMPDTPFLCDIRRGALIMRRAPVHRDRRVPQPAPRPRGKRLPHAVLRRRGPAGRPRHRPVTLLRRHDGRRLPALHLLRRLPPLRRRQGPQGLRVQRPRGRRRTPPARTTRLGAGAVLHPRPADPGVSTLHDPQLA